MTPFLFKWSEVLHIYCKCKCCYFDKNIITGYIRSWQKWQLLTQSITKISSELRYFHFSIVQTQTPPIWPMYSHTRNSFPTNQQLYTQAHTREWHHITPHEICTVSLWFYHLSGWIHVVNSEHRELSWCQLCCNIMTLSIGNIFHFTGPLCREFTSHQWIPLTKASNVELWCFLWSVPEQMVE